MWTAGLACAATAVAQEGPAPIRITLAGPAKAGVATSVWIELVGDGGYRLGGASLRAWLVPAATGTCEVPSRLAEAIEIDGRFVITLNEDATISAINPDRNLASSNIAWIAWLPAMPTTWRVDDAREEAWFAFGDGRSTRIDTTDGRLIPPATDTATEAHNRIALPWDGRSVAMAAGRLAVYRADGAADWDLPLPLLAATAPAFSVLSRRAYALAENGASVVPIDLDARRVASAITLPAKADILLASGDGRWLFAIARQAGLVTVIDVARERPVRAIQIHAGIERAALSESYLYLRERERAFVSMVRLASLGEEREHVVAIPVGRSPSGDAMASMGDGMAFLHSGERAIYLYMESGMADNHGTMRSPTEMLAPYAVLPVRGGKPVDIAFTQRGLRTVGTGRYAGRFRLPHGGRWRLVARDTGTRSTACHDFTAAGAAATVAAARHSLVRDQTHSRRLRVEGGGDAALPERIALLAMIPASNWQKTVVARRIGERLFELDEAFPDERVMVVPLDPTLAADGPIAMGGRP